MKSNCPDCATENNPIDSFPRADDYFIHHHYKCSSCNRKWGTNELLPRPPELSPPTLEEKIRAEVLKLKDEGLL